MEATALTAQVKRVRDSTCLFRAYAAHCARNQETYRRWIGGACDSAEYNSKQHLSKEEYAKNYARSFPWDCPAVTNCSDSRAPAKLASRLEALSKRLSPADRQALAPQLSAAALAKSTGVAHTAGECDACKLLRETLPPELRAAGLPSSRKGPPAESADIELGAVREEDRGSTRDLRVQKCPVHSHCRLPPSGQRLVHHRPALPGRLWGDAHATHMPRKADSTASPCPPGKLPSAWPVLDNDMESRYLDIVVLGGVLSLYNLIHFNQERLTFPNLYITGAAPALVRGPADLVDMEFEDPDPDERPGEQREGAPGRRQRQKTIPAAAASGPYQRPPLPGAPLL